MEKAHEKGMKIVLNPSPMNEKIFDLQLDYIDYFILNEIEAGQILRQDIKDGYNGAELAEALLKRFPSSSIVLTMGGDGSVFMDQKETVLQPVYKVKAVDTTAAGDTFTGFFISGITKGLPVIQAMDLASKAAAIAVTRRGAAPSIPFLEEAERFTL